MKQFDVVAGKDRLEEINRALALPRTLVTDDGRELIITGWNPSCSLSAACTVTVEATILVPKESDENPHPDAA